MNYATWKKLSDATKALERAFKAIKPTPEDHVEKAIFANAGAAVFHARHATVLAAKRMQDYFETEEGKADLEAHIQKSVDRKMIRQYGKREAARLKRLAAKHRTDTRNLTPETSTGDSPHG